MSMKISLLSTLMLLLNVTQALSISSFTGQKHFYPVRERLSLQSLNGTWKFKLVKGGTLPDELERWNEPGFNTAGWDDILVPGNWETQGFKDPEYGDIEECTGLYSRTFNYNTAWQGKHVILRFDGVHFGYECYVNGHKAGEWGSAYNLCQFDITPYLNVDKPNKLCVLVSTRSMGWEFDVNDCWALAGITRDVELFSLDNIYLEDVACTTEVTPSLDAEVKVDVNVGYFNEDDGGHHYLSVAVSDMLNNHLLDFKTNIDKDIAAYSFRDTIMSPKLWTAETPNLYRMEVCVTDSQGKVIQRVNEKIGIRTVTIEGTTLQVNHKPVRLHGVCLNEIDPQKGRALSYKERRKQLEMMKAAHINFIRTAHYPFAPDFYDLCDEMGIYVCCEVPFGHGDEHLTDMDYLPELLSRAEATLRRDKDHPSVIIWSIGNENPYTDVVEEVIKYVKQKDPTRPRGLPQTGEYFMDHRYVMSDNVDIYMAHYLNVDKINSAVEDIKKPLLLTEYAHSYGLAFNDFEAQYANILAHPEIAGGSVWCWTDQAILTNGRNVAGKPFIANYKRAEGDAVQGVWIDPVRYMDSNDYSGTDGIVYADGYPQEDYFAVRKVYSPAIIYTDTLTGEKGKTNTFTIYMENRFDFIPLDGYTLHWELRNIHRNIAKGIERLQAEARTAGSVSLQAVIPQDVLYNDLMLYTTIEDASGKDIYEKNIPVILKGSEKDYLNEIQSMPSPKKYKTKTGKDAVEVTTGDISCAIDNKGVLQIKDKDGKNLVNSPLYLRVGRRVTTTLQYRGSKNPFYWNPYILSPVINSFHVTKGDTRVQVEMECRWNRVEKPEEFISGRVTVSIYPNGLIGFDYHLTPSENATGNLMECGLTIQLTPSFDTFRWRGNGPFNQVPGKSVYNNQGYWALHKDDIRFNGNKGSVDIGVMTNETMAIGCWSGNGNLYVENKDNDVFITQNIITTGYGSKFTPPMGLCPVDKLPSLNGKMALFVNQPVDGTSLLDGLFKPYKTAVPENPYYKSYGW